MTDTNDQIDVKEEDLQEDEFSPEELADDSIDWKAKAEELKGIAKRRATQLKKFKDAATKAVEAAKAAEAAKEADKAITPQPASQKTGELDETQLDYLDLKGISEPEDVDIIQKVMKKTGQTVRQTLKDDYVQAKLNELKAAREVKNATPSSTKRGGSQSDGFDLALDKFERTGELPQDFELRKKVVNARLDKENPNKPSWK
jgi:predicted ATPase